MAYTQTTRLQLKKAVPGTNQAFETSEINNNWDKVDAEAVAVDARLDAAESSITSIQGLNTTQDGRLTALETKTNSGVVYNSTRWNGRQIFVQNTAPTTGMVTGDIWIQA